MVLVVTVVLALVVVGVATYASATLRHGQVMEQSADRLATVDGATDNALEALSRNTSLCALSALSSQPGGYTYQLGDQINGIDPTINCTAVGGGVKAVDAYAVIMTGAGGQTGPLLTIANGGSSAQAQKTFEGPVYLARTPNSSSTSFSANLTIKNGDLWYTGACPGDPTLAVDPRLSITPAGYGTQCVSHDWQTLFGSLSPPEFDVDTLTTSGTSTPTVDAFGCHVWGPGRYTSAPALANQTYNYFKSGNYYFENIGNWTIGNAAVLFGYPGATGQSIPGYKNSDTFSTNPCNAAWQADSPTGASLFMGGNSSITLDNNSALEISGADQGAYRVAIQTLESKGLPSSLTGDQRVVRSGPGSNKQLSVQGLVWAPHTGFEFDLIANDAVAALTGGAVVSELVAGASAQANNFLITVGTQPSTSSFVFTATARNSGTTTVRTLLTYRTDGFYELTSRRVLNLTPE
jgi:hypothetical protein